MVSKYEKDYLAACQKVLDEGVWINNKRTGTKCLTIPKLTFTYDVSNDPLPVLTTKQSYPVSAWAEMVGYLRRYEWADLFDKIGSASWYVNSNETEAWVNNPARKGENHIGTAYGAALEEWELPELFSKLMAHEDDRGLMINFWRPAKFKTAALRPCLYSHLFTIIDGTLHLTSSQRSCDLACGKNFNALSLYIMLKVFAHITGLKAGKVVHEITNPHIYESHIEGIKEQLSRTPLPNNTTFKVNDWVRSFEDITERDNHARDYFTLTGYDRDTHLGKIPFDLVA
jgi:thymidylate synthase